MIANREMLFVACLLSAGPLLTSCATTATPEAMIATVPNPAPGQVVASSAQSIEVSVSGAGPGLEAADFKSAIESSLVKVGIASSEGGAPKYRLTARIVELDKPFAVARITTNLDVAWSLTRIGDDRIVLQKEIQSTYTTGAFDSFAGAVRTRMSVEGAARKNIEAFVEALRGTDFSARVGPETSAPMNNHASGPKTTPNP